MALASPPGRPCSESERRLTLSTAELLAHVPGFTRLHLNACFPHPHSSDTPQAMPPSLGHPAALPPSLPVGVVSSGASLTSSATCFPGVATAQKVSLWGGGLEQGALWLAL